MPYSQSAYYTNAYGTYRTDCSGYVSMIWGLGSSYTTWTLPKVSHAISKDELASGDVLLDNTSTNQHVVMFDSWADSARTYYWAYEQTPPKAVYHKIPYPYWAGYGPYTPYRKNGVNVGGAFAEGSFISYNGHVYRIAGGAPVYVSSWTVFGGTQPTTAVSDTEFNALKPYPSNGTFVNGLPSGRVFRFAGGAPEYVSTWNSYGGSQPTISVDDFALDRPGGAAPLDHMRQYPVDGTLISNTADGRVYRVAGGAPLYVSSWSNIGGEQPSVGLDPWEFSQYQHLRPVPVDMFLRGLPSQRIFRVVRGGHPYYVESWDPYGGSQPFLDVDDWAIDNCDHLNCSPFGYLDNSAGAAGTVAVAGWAIDPNARTSPVSVHVYVGGPAGAAGAEGFDIGVASAVRTDVQQAYPGTGQNHGFSSSVTTSKRGSQPVYVYAINASGTPGGNVLLGQGAVTISDGVLTGPVPTISPSSPQVGQVVTATAGAWSPAPVTLAYQWYRVTPSGGSVSAITGATASTYAVQSTDTGFALQVKVTGSKAGYQNLSQLSQPTAVVPALTLTETPVPTIAGTARVDQTMTATPGTWGPSPVSLTFQWNRGNTPIPGANSAVYTVQAADVGSNLTVSITGSKPGYASVTKTSAPTAAVTLATLTVTPVPTITGTAKVGQTLTANAGSWGPAPVTLSYQWYRGTTMISGATSATYVPVSADVKVALKVVVTGSKPGYSTISRTSKSTSRVIK